MKFVIESESERGFWSDEDGWIFGIDAATQYDVAYVEQNSIPPVISRGNDARWRVVLYD